jgi:hypothetical protein
MHHLPPVALKILGKENYILPKKGDKHIHDLPNDCLLTIFKFLNLSSFSKIVKVSRRWKHLLYDHYNFLEARLLHKYFKRHNYTDFERSLQESYTKTIYGHWKGLICLSKRDRNSLFSFEFSYIRYKKTAVSHLYDVQLHILKDLPQQKKNMLFLIEHMILNDCKTGSSSLLR